MASAALWRIAADTLDYSADDLSGAGAKATGGRWNRKGSAVLYTSCTVSLACLETVVHLVAGGLPYNRYLVRLDVPDNTWRAAQRIDPAQLVGWDAIPTGAVSLDAGDRWLASLGSALLMVPSVIVPEEWNVLINPLHPQAATITATKERKFLFDGRLSY